MFHFKLFILLILTKESWIGAKLKLTVSRVTLQWPYISAVRQQISTTDCCLLYNSQRAETQQWKPAAASSLDFFSCLFSNSVSWAPTPLFSHTLLVHAQVLQGSSVLCGDGRSRTRPGSGGCKVPELPAALRKALSILMAQTNSFSINYNIKEQIIPKWELRILSALNVSHYTRAAPKVTPPVL